VHGGWRGAGGRGGAAVAQKIDFHCHWNGEVDLLDEWVAAEREAGLERAVVFDTHGWRGEEEHPEQVLAAAEQHPDFVVPFFNVDWADASGRTADEMKGHGFVGAKLILPPAPYDDDRFFDLYEGLARNGMICLFHTAVVAGGGSEAQMNRRDSSRRMRPVHLDRIARSFPEMPIVGAHIGYPWYAEACAIMRWHKNVWFDTSTSQLTCGRRKYIKTGPELGAKPIIRQLYVGGDLEVKKVVYGSDTKCPMKKGESLTAYATRLTDAAMDDLDMPAEVRRMIYHDNAAGVLESAGIGTSV